MERQLRCARRLAPLVFAVLILGGRTAEPTDLRNVLVDYRVSSWTAKDGLPTGTIWSLAQDHDGYLWLGADFGLLRFDGVRFVSWEGLGHAPLPERAVQVLAVSRDGSLWIGFGGRGGISRVFNGQVRTYGEAEGLPPTVVTAIIEDRAGTVWAGTDTGLYQQHNGRWERWTADDGVGGHAIRTASLTAAGDLLVATDMEQFRRAVGSTAFERITPARDSIQSIVGDASGTAWVTDRISGFHNLGTSSSRTPAVERGKGMRLLLDHRGDLWVATFGQGLWRARVNVAGAPTVERVTDLTGLSNNVTYSLLEDREGNIWAGTTDGLNRLTPQRLTHITDLGLVTGLEVTTDNSVWAGTADGLVRLPPSGSSSPSRATFASIRVDAMQSDEQGGLWVATPEHLLIFKRGSDKPDVVTDRLRRVRGIASDAAGGAWVHDSEEGLVHVTRNNRLESSTLPPEVKGLRPTVLLFDKQQRLWIGFNQGQIISTIDGVSFSVFGAREGLDIGAIRAIQPGRDGTLWVGGSRGLAQFASGRFNVLSRGESVTGMIEDRSGSIWLGTASGIMRISRSSERGGDEAAPLQTTLYDSADGVAGTAGWIGQRSLVRTHDGLLWFLTGQGVTVIDPRLFRDANSSPVHIDAIVVNDRRMLPKDALELPPNVSRLEVDYTVLNLTSPRRTRFRYRLEGFDKDWIDAGIARQAIYTNLPPRTYRFRVEATDARGGWGSPVVAWSFTVQPAFYQTGWFLATVATLIGLSAWGAWQLRLRQVQQRFLALIGERIRLSREIHDTLLQSLVGVALQLDNVSQDLDDSSPAKQGFVRMRRQVEEYIREARQSIWNLRSSTLDAQGLASALRQCGDRAQERGIDFAFAVSGTPRPCSARIEEQLLRISQEAVLNAVRHSGAQRVGMQLTYAAGDLRLRVSDNGHGFDPARVPDDQRGHWGMTSMRERAESIGARLFIRSNIGHGTDIELIVPAAN